MDGQTPLMIFIWLIAGVIGLFLSLIGIAIIAIVEKKAETITSDKIDRV